MDLSEFLNGTETTEERPGEEVFGNQRLYPDVGPGDAAAPINPGPCAFDQMIFTFFSSPGFRAEVEFVRDGPILMFVLTIILKRLIKQPMLFNKFMTTIRLL